MSLATQIGTYAILTPKQKDTMHVTPELRWLLFKNYLLLVTLLQCNQLQLHITLFIK